MARARNTDPATSHNAATKVNEGWLDRVILRCLDQFPSGLTTHEIEDITSEHLVSVSPRMKPLEGIGMVERCGKRIPPGQKVPSTIWRVTQKGRDSVMAKAFAWSYSALKNFETCPRRYYHYNVAKDVKEQESEHIQFGHAVHSAFEARVKTGTPLPMGMGMHEGMLARLAEAPGEIYAEQKLAMDANFGPASWFGDGAWLRSVLDYTNVRDETATVIDYKTGRPSEDLTQLQLSAAMVFTHRPRVNRVKSAMVFVAHNQVERAEFVRDDLTEIWSEILPRVNKLAQAKASGEYPAKPGGLCKRWCGVVSCPYQGK